MQKGAGIALLNHGGRKDHTPGTADDVSIFRTVIRLVRETLFSTIKKGEIKRCE
jgi:hypothetical protein